MRILFFIALSCACFFAVCSFADKEERNVTEQKTEESAKESSNEEDSLEPESEEATTKGYKVLRVVDGDTIHINYKGEETTVRFIGVDTPESVHSDESRNTEWGKKASEFTTKKLDGQTVYLEFDKDKYDQYGRLLAYVYTEKNGKKVMFNKTLVKQGYARAAYYSPNGKYRAEFEKLQEKAKKSRKGFWADGFETAFPGKTED